MSRSTPRPTAGTAVRVAAGLLAIGAVTLSACGSSDTGSGSSAASSPSASMSPSMSGMSMSPGSAAGSSGATSEPSMADMIMIQDFRFTSPASVKPGSKVEVMNMDSEAHTVTADAGHAFDVTVPPGRTVELTAPSKPGDYAFHCSYHSNMHATLRVR